VSHLGSLAGYWLSYGRESGSVHVIWEGYLVSVKTRGFSSRHSRTIQGTYYFSSPEIGQFDVKFGVLEPEKQEKTCARHLISVSQEVAEQTVEQTLEQTSLLALNPACFKGFGRENMRQ